MALEPKVVALIVAAGSGRRMQQDISKQYLPLGGTPILTRTLIRFGDSAAIDRIYLVAPSTDLDFCRQSILNKTRSPQKIRLVAGGESRQQSVYNGLRAMAPFDGLVAIHDGVRPFITESQLIQCIQKADSSGACILALPVTDTVKKASVDHLIEDTVNRQGLWLAQTPQIFSFDIIFSAHRQARLDGYRASDDAMLVERTGKKVSIIPGSPFNIKITLPEHLTLAEAILRIQSQ